MDGAEKLNEQADTFSYLFKNEFLKLSPTNVDIESIGNEEQPLVDKITSKK